MQFTEYGFTVGFYKQCQLEHIKENCKSATDFPCDVEAYLNVKIKFGAIKGPFDSNPIQNCHYSPFMTRPKPDSETRRVIVDLSWPKGTSVNDGVEKMHTWK